MTYFNAAGHGLPDAAVRARMIAYLRREDEIGVDRAEIEAAAEAAQVRHKTARVIGASPDDVAMMPSTTAASNAAILSLPLAGKRVLVAPGAWSSDVAVLHRMGARIETIPCDGSGLDLTAMQGRIDQDLGAIFVPMICSLTGERYPVERIAAMARPDTCPYIVDAAQAVGQTPVDVGALGCDVLVSPLRKWMRGPRGTAFLWMHPRVLAWLRQNPMPDFGSLVFRDGALTDRPGVARFQPMGVYAFMPQVLGLGVALDQFLARGQDATFAALTERANRVRAILRSHDLDLAAPAGAESCIVTARGPRGTIDPIFEALQGAGIMAKNPGIDCEPLRPAADGDAGYLRISAHLYNTESDLARLSDVIGAARGIRAA